MQRIILGYAVVLLFSVLLFSQVQAGTDDLIFIHHSCGANWLSDGLNTALDAKSYIDEVNEITYGDAFSPDTGRPASLGSVPGDNTNMDHWILWFNDYLQQVKQFGCANGTNNIIMFKSCFPISQIYSDGIGLGNPFIADQSLVNYQAVYRHPLGSNSTYTYNLYTYKPLDQIFAENPDILFVPVTAPSNIPPETCNEWADRARVFNNWLKNVWLPSYNAAHPTLHNVAVFDWFDVLTYPDNYTGTEVYTPGNGDTTGVYPVRNMTRAEYRTGDSHPNTVANETSTVVFATSPLNFIDAAYTYWQTGTPEYLNSYGTFSVGSDTTQWYFEKYGDGSASGNLTWVSNYSDQTGVLRLTQVPGEKGKISQVFNVTTPGWYTAVAKVATDITDPAKQQKVYLYLQQLDNTAAVAATGNQVLAYGSGALSPADTWRTLKVSFYAETTFLGVQVVGINMGYSGVTGSLYIDDVWVYAGAEIPTETVSLTNPDFSSGITGWLVQPYGDASTAGTWSAWSTQLLGTQTGGEKGKISQIFNFASSGINAGASVLVFSSASTMANTQKVYLYVYSYDSGYTKVIESANAIFQAGKWAPGEWHELQLGFIPLTGYNAVQMVGINPIGAPFQALYFDDVIVRTE